MYSVIFLAALAFGPAATDDIFANERTVVVNVAAADLASPASLRQLRYKVQAATNEVCGRVQGLDLRTLEAVQDCRRLAMRSAERQLAALSGAGSIRLAAR